MPFKSELKIESVRRTNERKLLDNLIYEYTADKVVVVVPIGFKTNFASIPGFVKGWIDNDAGYIRDAAVVHDYLYSQKRFAASCVPLVLNTRKQADKVLRAGMKDLKASWVKRQVVYISVRLFGASFYKRQG